MTEDGKLFHAETVLAEESFLQLKPTAEPLL